MTSPLKIATRSWIVTRSWMPVHSHLAARSVPLHAEVAYLARNYLNYSDLINVSGMSTVLTSAPDLQLMLP